MKYKLIVDHYGKIEHAEVVVAPLTLFVGDNNSGKSYLLSLIWALNGGAYNLPLFEGLETLELPQLDQVWNRIWPVFDGKKESVQIHSSELVPILNLMLDRNKQKIADSIFNFQGTPIGGLCLEPLEDIQMTISVFQRPDSSHGSIAMWGIYPEQKSASLFVYQENEAAAENGRLKISVMRTILQWMLKQKRTRTIYLPAARTGFVLAKDIINQVSRQTAYDLLPGEEAERVQPFPKPILEFLNSLEKLSSNAKVDTKREQLVGWMENHMAQGSIRYTEVGAKEIQYVPEGAEKGIPMRSSSAVITELAPLLLFLKYERFLGMLCYEEPETCLHPQLQLQMGRLLIRLVNQGTAVVATTHSDIILQHVNNMIKAYEYRNDEKFLGEAQIDQDDCLNIQDVAVYQFTNQGKTSVVEELKAGKDGFPVPTFSNALMDILDRTTMIQEYK